MADNFCLSTQSPWLQSFDHGVADDQDICIDDRLRGRGLHFFLLTGGLVLAALSSLCLVR